MVLLGNSEQEVRRFKVLAAGARVLMKIGAVAGRGDKARADDVITEVFAVPALALVSSEDRRAAGSDKGVGERWPGGGSEGATIPVVRNCSTPPAASARTEKVGTRGAASLPQQTPE